MDVIEMADEDRQQAPVTRDGGGWVNIYRYAYSSALTDIVGQIQELQYYTKQLVGEVGFDIADTEPLQ
jgi:hypothetical protein